MTDIDTRGVQGGSYDLGDRNETWDAGTAEKSYDLPADAGCYMWRNPDGDKSAKSSYKLPFASKTDGKHAVWKAITAIAAVVQGGRGGLKGVSDSDLAAIKTKVESYYAKARKKYGDDSIRAPWDDNDGDEKATASRDVELRYMVSPISGIEVRDPSESYDNTWTMAGYAAVFDTPTVLYDGKFVRVSESIDPGAFDKLLRTQALGTSDGVVHFNFGHDMNRAVAATDVPAGQPGSLILRADSRGLSFVARVSRDDPDAVAMAAKMRTGVLKQASFAFTVAAADNTTTENEEGPDEMHRRITEVGHLYDVCATPQGAYPQTVSQLRSYAAALGASAPEPPFDRASEAESDVRPAAEGSVVDVSTEEREPVETAEDREAREQQEQQAAALAKAESLARRAREKLASRPVRKDINNERKS